MASASALAAVAAANLAFSRIAAALAVDYFLTIIACLIAFSAFSLSAFALALASSAFLVLIASYFAILAFSALVGTLAAQAQSSSSFFGFEDGFVPVEAGAVTNDMPVLRLSIAGAVEFTG